MNIYCLIVEDGDVRVRFFYPTRKAAAADIPQLRKAYDEGASFTIEPLSIGKPTRINIAAAFDELWGMVRS